MHIQKCSSNIVMLSRPSLMPFAGELKVEMMINRVKMDTLEMRRTNTNSNRLVPTELPLPIVSSSQ